MTEMSDIFCAKRTQYSEKELPLLLWESFLAKCLCEGGFGARRRTPFEKRNCAYCIENICTCGLEYRETMGNVYQ